MKYQNINSRRYFEEKEIEWLRENYPVLGIAETTRLFNKIFNRDKSVSTLKKYCVSRLGLKVCEERKRKRYDNIRSKEGTISQNCRGELRVKTENGWKSASQIYGKPPKGYIAYHLNGDKTDNSKDNIIIIKNGVQTIIRNAGLQSENKDIARTSVKWAELYQVLPDDVKRRLRNEHG